MRVFVATLTISKSHGNRTFHKPNNKTHKLSLFTQGYRQWGAHIDWLARNNYKCVLSGELPFCVAHQPHIGKHEGQLNNTQLTHKQFIVFAYLFICFVACVVSAVIYVSVVF